MFCCERRTGRQRLTNSAACAQLLWPGLFARYGAPLLVDFDLSTLAHITDRFSSGALDCVVRSLLTKRRLERVPYEKVGIPEILQWLSKVWGRARRRTGCGRAA